ncbi:MAG: D-aminoacyl-tRNA deacylase [Thermoplasmatales archaeon]|nr:MAG: D-aminoacyl-tRNA deacylase [Thermoplasmatales archaeon]
MRKYMAVIIVSSIEDSASTNIKKRLLEQSTWDTVDSFDDISVYRHSTMQDIVIVTINNRKITRENLDLEIENKLGIKPKQVIFISRHTSKMKKPTLTVHPIGNYGEARFGGIPKTLVTPAPRLMTHLLRLIKKNLQSTNLGYQVCYEVTHHGPFLETPTLFVEIGSTEKEWRKKEPAKIIAQSILQLLEKYRYEEDCPDDITVLLGIGGGHYAPRFTDVVFEKKAAFGHMIPSYQIDAGCIDSKMLEKTMNATPKLKAAYFHKKALKKSQVTEYKKWFQNKGFPVISSKELSSLD